MDILICEERHDDIIEKLLEIWRGSVFATHTFLTLEDIDRIAQYVPAALRSVPWLVITQEKGRFTGFAGGDGRKLEMLFISADFRGRGIGKKLMQYLFEHNQVVEVCVNEQNPQARGFYEHMGFQVYRREAFDEQGNPFPLLYMKL